MWHFFGCWPLTLILTWVCHNTSDSQEIKTSKTLNMACFETVLPLLKANCDGAFHITCATFYLAQVTAMAPVNQNQLMSKSASRSIIVQKQTPKPSWLSSAPPMACQVSLQSSLQLIHLLHWFNISRRWLAVASQLACSLSDSTANHL